MIEQVQGSSHEIGAVETDATVYTFTFLDQSKREVSKMMLTCSKLILNWKAVPTKGTERHPFSGV